MRQKLILAIGILALLASLCFGVWDNDKPADSDAWNNAAGFIRDNWDALEVVLGVDLDTDPLTVTDIVTGGPIVDVRAHGAVGDGATDDTTAILDAETAATAANAAVYFPPGTYKITGALTTSARAYIGDGGDGTKTVIKQFTVDTAIFQFSSMSFKKFEGLTFDANADGVYAFKQTTAEAHTNHCTWRDCYFTLSIERGVHANLIYATFQKVRFGEGGAINGNNIHTAIFSHGTAARNTNVNNFFHCSFLKGKGGNGFIDISLGIGWQFYSCVFEDMSVTAVYVKDLYSLSFPNCHFEQRSSLGSGQDCLLYLGSDGTYDMIATFTGIFVILTDATDINHFITFDHSGAQCTFHGGHIKLDSKDLTDFSGDADFGILSILGVKFIGFDDQAKRYGVLETGNIIAKALEGSQNTLLQSIDFENTFWGHFEVAPFASIRAHTSDTGDFNYDSSELSFHTVENETNGMKERLRIDSIGMLHNKQDTGDVVLFTHQEDALADDGTVNLPNATSGMVFVSCNAEAGMWLVQNDGAVTKISGSTNTAATDSDTDLCVFDGGGTTAFVKNRLGVTGEIRIVYYHN